MGSLPLDALQPGMILAEDLHGPDGKMLLPKGMVLTDSHIQSLRTRGVLAAVIADGEAEEAGTPFDPELLAACEAHVSPFFCANDPGHPVIETLYALSVERLAASLVAGKPMPKDIAPSPRAESLGDLFFKAEGGAKDIVSSEVKLASFPDIYFKIRQVLDSPTSSTSQVADVISKDTSLTAKLLKLVNSPFYGLPQRIDSISRAVMVIGGQEISTLALGISAINAFKDIPPELINMRTFWEHSVAVGSLAQVIGKRMRHGAGERLFVAGILHDIGRLIIFKKLPHAAVEAIYYAKANQVAMVVAENEVLGFAHPQVGGLLLRAWKFPEALVSLVACHHKPLTCPDPIEPSILHLADLIAVAVGLTPPASAIVPPLEPAAWSALGLAPEDLPDLVAEGLAQVDAIIGAFFPSGKN